MSITRRTSEFDPFEFNKIEEVLKRTENPRKPIQEKMPIS